MPINERWNAKAMCEQMGIAVAASKIFVVAPVMRSFSYKDFLRKWPGTLFLDLLIIGTAKIFLKGGHVIL